MNITRKVFLTRSHLLPWVLATRPKTLYAGIAPVILGSALALQAGSFQLIPAILCLLFSFLVQIGCNYANDYYDFVNGVDTKERIGFKRMVSSGVIAPKSMKLATFLVLLVAFFIGCGLIRYGGWELLLVGGMSIACAIAYTGGPFPLGYYGLGDIFVFIFYGLIAVMFTFYVQANYFSTSAFWVAVGCGCLAANIRLVNDVRDKETDSKAGKKTSVVRFGYKFCYMQYITSTFIACCLVPLILVTKFNFNMWIFLPTLLIVMYIRIIVNLMNAQTNTRMGESYNALLAQSAKMLFLYAVLLSVGIFLN